MFEPLKNILQRVQSLSVGVLMQELAKDREIIDFIVELNTIEQLYTQGIDSKGTKLKSPIATPGAAYAYNTIHGGTDITGKHYAGKLSKGQPIDRVTLKDTGDFYRSFKVYIDGNDDFVITADSVKDGIDIILQWGGDILGLTPESQARFNEMVRRKVPDIAHKYILKAA